MTYRLKVIEDQTPVSRFLEDNGASHFSMINRGKPTLKADTYFALFAEATEGEIAYFYSLDLSRWEELAVRLAKSRASLLILNSELSLFVRPQMNQSLLFCAQPKMLFAQLVKNSIEEIHADAVIWRDDSCHISSNSMIESGAQLGRNVTIEANCCIYANVTIGNNVTIKANSVIGGSGFEFYKNDEGDLCHFPHSGGVTIGDDVYIGSGVVIDAAVFKQTIIGRGTKIDNLASIAHNVQIGENCLIMANTSIAGSVKIGSDSRICLAAAIRDGVTIGSGTVIGMNSCVTKDIPDNVTAMGVPAVVKERKKQTRNDSASTTDSPHARTIRLITETVNRLQLDLSGLTVISEAATGQFAVTASIAALAGAKVQAIAADSPYGSAQEAADATLALANAMSLGSNVEIVTRDHANFRDANIVTNLGFVRPCDHSVISQLNAGTVIPVMYDSRELRPGEIDLDSCRERGIHVVGTNEEHPLADILSYCGPLAVRLLMEQNLELRGTRVAVAGDNFFTKPITRALERMGAEVTILTNWSMLDQSLLGSLDLLLYVDYWNQLGNIADSPAASLLSLASGATIIQLVGGLSLEPFRTAQWKVVPSTPLSPHRMWRTLAYLGPRPVVELHAAGLKAAELQYRGVDHDSGTQFDGLRQPIIAFRQAEVLAAR